MRRLALIAARAAAPSAPAAAFSSTTVSIAASADVGFPFWCDWDHDGESRCYRDDGPRLPIGGVDDKVWRAGLRFPLTGVPAATTIAAAELRVYHDGTCVAPGAGSAPCVATGAVVDANRILTKGWFRQREPEFDERVLATAGVFSPPDPKWLTWEVTAPARSWHRRLLQNNGVLLKLQDGDEDYGAPGPYGPSSSHPVAAPDPAFSSPTRPPGAR